MDTAHGAEIDEKSSSPDQSADLPQAASKKGPEAERAAVCPTSTADRKAS